MIEFFKNLSAINSSLISIIFAFILGKIFGLTENIEKVSDNIDHETFELEKLKIEIRNIGIKENTYNVKIENAKKIFFENYLSYRDGNLDEILKSIIKEKNIFFLTINDLKKEITVAEEQFLLIKKEEIYNYIEKNIESKELMENIKKMQFYQILNEKKILTEELIENEIKKLKSLTSNELQSYLWNKICYNLDRENTYYGTGTGIQIIPSFENLHELEKKLELFPLINDKLEKEKKKISSLKRETTFLRRVLVGLYIIFIFGVIYPLSYIKYENGTLLDYSLYNNFLLELFSVSGLILLGLTTIITIFFGVLYKMLNINISIENSKELESKDWILSNYLEYLKY